MTLFEVECNLYSPIVLQYPSQYGPEKIILSLRSIFRVDLNPSKTKSKRAWFRIVRTDFLTLFFDLLQIICSVCFFILALVWQFL